MCGAMMTLGAFRMGQEGSGGSEVPDVRGVGAHLAGLEGLDQIVLHHAPYPRPVFTMTTPFFILAKASLLSMPLVWSVRGVWMLM